MTFISYAQNYEDVMLYRVLKHVKNGFYIDVGANHPIEDSVTKAFYDLGWQGINIEPLESYIALLEEARPRDKNIQCALSDRTGSLDIWSCDVRGWETLDKNVADEHEANGFHGEWKPTQLRTLAEIANKYSPPEVHFLKVDVEGYEKQVLLGADFKSFRPWVIVVEATLPGSTIENHEEWEFILTGSGYRFVYADGLNRFYLAEEQSDLERFFKYPPNIFDEFSTQKELSLVEWAQNNEVLVLQARAQIEELRRQAAAQVEELRHQTAQLDEHIAKLNIDIDNLVASTSWRATAPLRHIKNSMSNVTINHVKVSIFGFVKKLFVFGLRKVIKVVNASPVLRRAIVLFINKLGFYGAVKKFYHKISSLDSVAADAVNKKHKVSHLVISPGSRKVLSDLQREIKKLKGEV
jgi:FkbM family methyltransferase